MDPSTTPQGLLLTTQEAADFLRVRRPTLAKLLEGGVIPLNMPNRHRRVRLRDLIDFQLRRRSGESVELSWTSSPRTPGELGLYEDTEGDDAGALQTARRGAAPALHGSVSWATLCRCRACPRVAWTSGRQSAPAPAATAAMRRP
ncbi:MAG: helix-turn-helix domain-containing protein [Actinomycetota bacterium]|nr:helix-turn-helix domain-containing protein [Actinomycetota bacterium]